MAIESVRGVGLALGGLLLACGGTEVITPFADSGGADDGGGPTSGVTIDPTEITTVVPDGDDTSSTSDGGESSGVSSTGEPTSTDGTVDPGSSGTTAADGSESSGTGADAVAPEVVTFTPADAEIGVAPAALVTVTFSEPMDPATITANVGTNACTGSLQLSADDFATCVPLVSPPQSAGGIVFTIVPAAPLQSTTTYRVRVLDTATDVAGNALLADTSMPTGFLTRYVHTIAIDGVNDFLPGEALATSTAGHTAYLAWDDAYVYLGFDSADVASGNSQTWVVAYFGDQMGSPLGVLYNTQQPALPFAARWHLRWRADNTFTGALEHDGADWQPPAWTVNPGDVYQSGTFVEMRVSRIDLDSPVYLDVTLGILREEPLDEASWAGMPAGTYVDGYDPDFAQYLQVDLTGSTLPSDVPIQP